ncbi:MAG: hypothetical protein M1822_007749 [Bathelium mastoideum]|nr:MAG: hypothetical protein M1822_007749 [Bathelium mastoideum]
MNGGTIEPYDGPLLYPSNTTISNATNEPISNFTQRHAVSNGLTGLFPRQAEYAIDQCPHQCEGLVPDEAAEFEDSYCSPDIGETAAGWVLWCTTPHENVATSNHSSSLGKRQPENPPEPAHSPVPEPEPEPEPFPIPDWALRTDSTSHSDTESISGPPWHCEGRCGPNERCYNLFTDDHRNYHHKAWCVETFDTYRVEAAQASDHQAFTMTLPEQMHMTTAYVEVVASADISLGGALPSPVLLSLYSVDRNNNALGQPKTCTNCGRLLYGPFPEGTASIRLEVTLPNNGDVIHLSKAFQAWA